MKRLKRTAGQRRYREDVSGNTAAAASDVDELMRKIEALRYPPFGSTSHVYRDDVIKTIRAHFNAAGEKGE